MDVQCPAVSIVVALIIHPVHPVGHVRPWRRSKLGLRLSALPQMLSWMAGRPAPTITSTMLTRLAVLPGAARISTRTRLPLKNAEALP